MGFMYKLIDFARGRDHLHIGTPDPETISDESAWPIIIMAVPNCL